MTSKKSPKRLKGPVPTPPPPASQPKPKIAPNPIDFRPNPFLTFKCALSSVVTCPRTFSHTAKELSKERKKAGLIVDCNLLTQELRPGNANQYQQPSVCQQSSAS